MTRKDTMMVSFGGDQKNVVPPWLRPIASIKLYHLCETHFSKECNFYCRVCMVALCKKCKKQHDLEHEIIKVEAVVKMNESGSMKSEAKRKVETMSEGSASNVQSFRKRPRKQKNL